MAAARVRVLQEGEKEGRRSSKSRGVSLSSMGGQGSEGAAVEAMVGHSHDASDSTVAPGRRREGERLTGGSLCQGFFLFCFSRISSRLVAFN